MFWLTSSIGISKLAVFVRLNTSMVNFSEERSVIWIVFEIDISQRFCHVCRKILRWPCSMKLVSYGSFAGMAPSKAPGLSKGKPKQDAFKANEFGSDELACAPDDPVSACLGEQPASGTTGFVMPSLTP